MNNKHNHITSTYYLLMKKLERDTGRNYVYEQFTKEKQRALNSTTSFSGTNIASPVPKNGSV